MNILILEYCYIYVSHLDFIDSFQTNSLILFSCVDFLARCLGWECKYNNIESTKYSDKYLLRI